MAKTADSVVTKAKSFLGVKESPAGSNNVAFNTDYYGKEVSGPDYPWCCTFVWDVFRLCNASELFYGGKKTARCQTVYEWGKEKKLTVPKGSGKKGDLIIFDWNGNGVAQHIGFILSKNPDGTYNTIEGNTAVGNDSNGGEVMQRKRVQENILAIVRPEYKSPSTGTTAAPAGTGDSTAKPSSAGSPGSAKANPYSIPARNVKKGQAGNAVRWVQWELNESGAKLTVDGDFGPKTLAAVQSFQKSKSLTVDGIAGVKTKAALQKAH